MDFKLTITVGGKQIPDIKGYLKNLIDSIQIQDGFYVVGDDFDNRIAYSIECKGTTIDLPEDIQALKDKTEEAEEYCYPEAFYFAFLGENEFTLLTKWEFIEGKAENCYDGYFRLNLPFEYEHVDGVYYFDDLSQDEIREKLLSIGMTENDNIVSVLDG